MDLTFFYVAPREMPAADKRSLALSKKHKIDIKSAVVITVRIETHGSTASARVEQVLNVATMGHDF